MVYAKLLLKNTEKYVNEFLELVFPKNILAKKMESEVKEHFEIVKWTIKKVFIAIALVYVFSGVFLGVHVVDSLFLGFIIFLYSNFLPDADSIFKKLNMDKNSKLYAGYARISKGGRLFLGVEEAKWYEKYALLFFAPIFIYYRIFQKAKYLYTTKEKPFHNIKSLFAYSSFLLLLGLVFYGNLLENISLPIFGGFGYYTHLFVDKKLAWR